MLFLPLEEDSLLFRLCVCYGLLVLLLELLVPLLFQRRVRLEIPRLVLHAPIAPLSTREFQQRRRALQQQLFALQRALTETPRRSPQKRRQLLGASAVKNQPAASPSPSPLTSPTSSVKVSRPESTRRSRDNRPRIDRQLVDDEGSNRRRKGVASHTAEIERQPPMAMSNSLATRERTARRGGFSFDEVIENDGGEEKSKDPQQEREDWRQAVNTRTVRRRESPTCGGRRPVRLVSEDVDPVRYAGPSEAASRLEALIGVRRRQRESSSTSSVPAPVAVRNHSPTPAPVSVPVTTMTDVEKPLETSFPHAPKTTLPEAPSNFGLQDEDKPMEEDEETKESEQREPLTDFQAFCASFAAGGTAAAQQAVAKRKHHEAFGSEDEQTNASATTSSQPEYKRKHPRVLSQDVDQPNGVDTAAAPQSADKRKHYEAFGSDDEQEIDAVVASPQNLDKRNHDQAFGADERQERLQEKTPKIVRRISFGDEVEALAASPPQEVPSERSKGKRKHKQAFSMIDEDEDDATWRESLAFRPHRVG